MTMSKRLTTSTFLGLAMLACFNAPAHAAQCGSGPGGFEAWNSSSAARPGPRASARTAIAALMQANYASATIAADRSQHSFSLSLDQFLAKRGRSTIVAEDVHSSSPRRRCSPRSSSATACRRGR